MHAAQQEALRAQLDEDRAQQVEFLEEHGTGPYNDTVTDIGVSSSGFSDEGRHAEERAELLGALETARHRVHQVDAALKGMDEGTYGTCANCGTEIPLARLEVRPLSVLCVECASKAEDR